MKFGTSSTSDKFLTSFYTKNWGKLVNSLNRYYPEADREDAVESVFIKLVDELGQKGPVSSLPKTENQLFYYIFNRAKAHLSNMKAKHARRVQIEKENFEDLAQAFGYFRSNEAALTAEYSRALRLALKMARRDRKVSLRDMVIFTELFSGKETVSSVSRRYGITEGNTYKIVCCVKKTLRNDTHGPNYLTRALDQIQNDDFRPSAA